MTEFTPCGCPEAELLRQVLTGEVPAVDTPMWAALVALVEAAAVRRLAVFDTGRSFQVNGVDLFAAPTELHRRRYPPHGDIGHWVRHGLQRQPIDRPALRRWAATGHSHPTSQPTRTETAA